MAKAMAFVRKRPWATARPHNKVQHLVIKRRLHIHVTTVAEHNFYYEIDILH